MGKKHHSLLHSAHWGSINIWWTKEGWWYHVNGMCHLRFSLSVSHRRVGQDVKKSELIIFLFFHKLNNTDVLRTFLRTLYLTQFSMMIEILYIVSQRMCTLLKCIISSLNASVWTSFEWAPNSAAIGTDGEYLCVYAVCCLGVVLCNSLVVTGRWKEMKSQLA